MEPLFPDPDALFRDMVEGLPVMFIAVDRRGSLPVFEYVSPYCRELTGYTQEELIGKASMLSLSYPGDIPRETSFPRMEKRHGVSPESPWFNSVFRIVTKTGRIKWVREVGRILFSPSGKQVGITAFISDCTTSNALDFLPFETNTKELPDVSGFRGFGGLIGDSLPMTSLYQRLVHCAHSDAPVLITGESGVGKELAARVIHELAHKGAPFVAINCGGINESLMESELFGHAEGAFTGAKGSSRGFIGQADGGVLFLDEVGEIPISMQIKLLRTLDGYGYIPVGSTKTVHSKFRLICATNRDTSRLVADGKMREDFFYRIHALPVHIPPLRAHKEDLPALIDHFLQLFSPPGQQVLIPNHIRLSLMEHDWPGNVRELRNVIRRFIVLGELSFASGPDDNSSIPPAPAEERRFSRPFPEEKQLRKRERDLQAVSDALSHSGGHVAGAAALLGLSERTLYRKLAKYGLRPENYRQS